MIQLTIMKITGYGPWTLTLGSDREHELQMLQASLYQKVQKLFSEKNGLVFQNRSDEFFAVTNGITLDEHIEIQKELGKLKDATLGTSTDICNSIPNRIWFSKTCVIACGWTSPPGVPRDI